MQNQTNQGPRKEYAGRFSDAAGSASPRTSTLRPRTDAGEAASRRPSGFAAPEAARAAGRPAPQEENARRSRGHKHPSPPRRKREKGADNKRGEKKRFGWKKALLLALALLLILAVALALILGGGGGTYHQLPRVERGSDSAYAPEGTVAPEGEASATEAPDIAALIEAGDYEGAAAAIEAGLNSEDDA